MRRLLILGILAMVIIAAATVLFVAVTPYSDLLERWYYLVLGGYLLLLVGTMAATWVLGGG